MWVTSNKRRAVIKDVRFVDWQAFNGFFEGFVLLPPFADGFFVNGGFPTFTCFIFNIDSLLLKNPMLSHWNS
jgi:hypothetical protein